MAIKNIIGIKTRVKRLEREIRNKKRLENKKYKKLRYKFLKKNIIDLVFLFIFGKFEKSTHIHHSNGRGFWLNDINYFIATTREGDKWIHRNKKLAKELGFITEAYYKNECE